MIVTLLRTVLDRILIGGLIIYLAGQFTGAMVGPASGNPACRANLMPLNSLQETLRAVGDALK